MKVGPKSSLRPFMHRALHLLNNEFSCLIPGLCGLQENISRANNLTGAGGLTQPNENKIFFLVPKNKTNELNYQNLFSACTLVQHARQSDVTQNTATELLDQFMLCIVYCLCIMLTCSTRVFERGGPVHSSRELKIKIHGSRKLK